MPLKGALQDFSLPDLFQLIHFGKKNGTLVIANGDAMGYVCFRNGNVFFATHNWKKPPLGQRLIEAGMISREQIDEALKLQETTHKGQRVGNILVELGYLSRESLEVFVEEQIRDAVFNLLRWKEGDFDFDPDQIFPEEDIGLSMRTEDLIMEGSRRLDEWFKIEKKVPSLDSVFSVTEAAGRDAGGLDLTSEERLVFNYVDGVSSVRDIIAKSGQSAMVTCGALYGLVTAGQVVPVGEAAPAESAGADVSVEEMTQEDIAGSVVFEEEAAEAAQVPEEEEISFGDGSDDELIIEDSGREPRKRAGRSRRRKRNKSEEEIDLEDGTDEDSVVVVEQETVDQEPVEQEAVEQEPGPGGEVSAETAEIEVAPREAVAADGAPAPGQSLVDYYKSMALKELGDSDTYRETEERKAFIEQAEKGELEQEDLREFDVVQAVEEEEGPAADMVEPGDIPMEWAGHLARLRGRTTKSVHGKGPAEAEAQEHPEAGEEEARELYGEAAAEDTVVIEEEAVPTPVAEIDFGSDIMADALDAVSPQPDAAFEPEPPPEPVIELEPERPEVMEEQSDALVHHEEPSVEEAVLSVEEGSVEEGTDLPTVEEAAAFDETALLTEDDIEKILQVSPTSRGELSREELLAFDQPTYPIVEAREGPPAPAGEQVAADGALEGVGVFEQEPALPAAADGPGRPGGAPGKVIQFSRASAERVSEVVLEQPEPVVRSTVVEMLAVAEDLQVPVLEPVAGSEELAVALEAVAEAEEAGETEFVLELVGLEEPPADANSLDSAGPRAARELELELETDTKLEATAELEAEEPSEQRAAREDEFAAVGEERFEDAGEGMVLAGSEAPGQEVASWGEQEPAVSAAGDEALVDETPTASAVELGEEPAEAPGLGLDHLEELREMAAGTRKRHAVEETQPVLDEAEPETAAADPGLDLVYEEEGKEEEGEDAGLLGPMKVSGRRDAGTCLVDLETFELEQELLELAGGTKPKKQKIAMDRTQAEPEAGRKEKKARGTGRSRGKEVDKGSVKKIIDDLKDK